MNAQSTSSDKPDYKRANVKCNSHFIVIDTLSGYFGSSLDPQGVQHLLSPDAKDVELGTCLLDALKHSRVVKPDEAPDLYDGRDGLARRYQQWVEHLMQRYGYKSKRAMFKNMRDCGVYRRENDVVTFIPSQHDALEGWTPLPEDQYVVIPWNSSANDAGAALRLALSRCIA